LLQHLRDRNRLVYPLQLKPRDWWLVGVTVAIAVFAIGVVLITSLTGSRTDRLQDVVISQKLHSGAQVLNDLQRLSDGLEVVALAGGIKPGSLDRVAQLAADVRASNAEIKGIPDAVTLAAPLREIAVRVDHALYLVDAAVANGLPYPHVVFHEVEKSVALARTYLDRHNTGLRQAEAIALDRYVATERRVRYSMNGLLVAVTLLLLATLYLFYREMSGKWQRRSAEARAAYLAYFDPLTELANRSKFQDELAGHVQSGQPFAVLMFDLDKFKTVNDTHGHAAGDVVLACFGARLGSRTTPYDGLAARLGGDEFAAILPTDNVERIATFCQQIIEDAFEPIPFDGVSLSVQVSIGAAHNGILPDVPGTTEELLLSAADYALYAAKDGGRSTTRLYDKALAREQSEQRNLITALPIALEKGDLVPFYQPKVDMVKNRIYGFEALVRWKMDGKFVAPNDFIPMAEQTGLILDVDRTILRQATIQTAHWNEMTGDALCVSVNLSTRHFRSERIISDVSEALQTSGLEPWLLTLEITETVLIEDWAQVNTILAELKALGVLISLDDFGTGYSSLAYLRKLAADELKIDSEFMRDIARSEETRFLLDAIVDMAHTMHMTIVVEGIETEDQAKIVVDFGCRLGQGYLWSPPLSAEKIEYKVLPNLNLDDTAGQYVSV